MTKERARVRKQRRRAQKRQQSEPARWRLAVFIFGFMIIFMGGGRGVQKGAEFDFSDIGFVLVFAAAMGLATYFRPSLFHK